MGFRDILFGKKGIDGFEKEIFKISLGVMRKLSKDNWGVIRLVGQHGNLSDNDIHSIVFELHLCLLSIGLFNVSTLAKVSEEEKNKIHDGVIRLYQLHLQHKKAELNLGYLVNYAKEKIPIYMRAFHDDLYSGTVQFQKTITEILRNVSQQIVGITVLGILLAGEIVVAWGENQDAIKRRF